MGNYRDESFGVVLCVCLSVGSKCLETLILTEKWHIA